MKLSIGYLVLVIIFCSIEVNVDFVPYTASIIHNKQHVCSGSIVSKEWVVTAAQCFIERKTNKNLEPRTITVSVGKENWEEGKKHEVSTIVKHKDFVEGTNKANIALLQVADQMTGVKPVDLQEEPMKNGVSVTTAGWSMAGETNSSLNRCSHPRRRTLNLHSSTRLQVADVTTAPLKECTAQPLGQASLCTIPIDTKKGQCVGDVGSPLVYKNKLVGVTSNPGNCRGNRSSVHNSVAYYHHWIRNTISPEPERIPAPPGDRVSSEQPPSETSFPYTAAIVYKKDYLCAGAIIGLSWVLTAAQCAKAGGKKISTSDLQVSVGNNTWMQGTYHEVFKIYIHSKFDPKHKTQDIAVIDVKKKFILGPTIQIIPLDMKNYDGATARVSGWGFLNGRNGKYAPSVRSASVVLSSLDKCELKSSDDRLCTVIEAGPCLGDMGGPLVLNSKLIGIVSTSEDCKKVKYATYSSIPHYHGWIKKQFELVSKTTAKSSNNHVAPVAITNSEHQYAASIWYDGDPLCAGTLVSSFVVLTVARHFFNDASGLEMPSSLFEVYLWGGPAGTIYWKTIHPDYEYDKPLHDIALVYLPILREHPHPPTTVNTDIEIDGEDAKTSYLSLYVNYKRKVEYLNVELLPVTQCKRYHRFINTRTMVCAFLTTSDGTCLEGTGQPLMFRNQMVAMQVYGANCEDLEPSVYLILSHYEDWIKDTIEDLSS